MEIEAYRARMPICREYNFMDHAAVGPVSGPAADAMRAYLDEAQHHAWARGGMLPETARVRQNAAKLLNCHPEEVTFVKNTSEGLGYVANGLQFSKGDNIVTTGVEFPANIYPWMNLRSHGVQLKMVPEDNGRIPLERLVELIDDRTRVVTVSAVQYASGFRTDLAALGTICQQRGVLFCVDAIQALGVLPLDVRAMKIDFLSADGHKWLLGPEGAGVFYCRHELLGLLRPSSVGWLNVRNATAFNDYRLEFRDDARRFDNGSYNFAGIWGLGASIQWLLGIGIDKIWQRVEMLTNRLADGVREKGYRLVSSRQSGENSGIVCFVSAKHDHARIVSHLRQEYRTVISTRGGRLRVSPHFYNTEDEIDQLIEHLPAH
ncbi:MAG: cysteine desulfurase [Phycisphaerae bacterium]|nr:MAG: aminotransferase class V-fold PLP-dependent enzyme [Planctomycetia bacterium]RIK69814.1 MAG: aminotransferase [Planctomycetota bacterium]GJQ25257.1 MAG: cysteine desulfurase [Phycisphaerae bacterium]